jgi:hypothetical protein
MKSLQFSWTFEIGALFAAHGLQLFRKEKLLNDWPKRTAKQGQQQQEGEQQEFPSAQKRFMAAPLGKRR